MAFWISWFQPTEDHRPLTYPPNKQVLGWWCTGTRCSDGSSILCSLIDASTEEEAKTAVKKDWPEAEEWRFCEERGNNVLLSDRFPISEWSGERIDDFISKSE